MSDRVTRAISMRDVLRAWHSSVAVPKLAAQEQVCLADRIVLTGCLLELCSTAPSLPEIGALMECTHSTALDRHRKWLAMPWRDRYAWLNFMERQVQIEVDRGRLR